MAKNNEAESRVEELYIPELLDIKIGKQQWLFQVPRGLICPQSSYFAKAFTEAFAEGQIGTITIQHAKDWEFECLCWLVLHEASVLAAEAGLSKLTATPEPPKNEDTPPNIQDPDEDSFDDPVTWSYFNLFSLYILGDYLDSKEFRIVVMDAVQIKVLQTIPRRYCLPSTDNFAMVFNNVSESSPLYKFALDSIVFLARPDKLADAQDLAVIPVSTLVKILSMTAQLVRQSGCNNCGDSMPCEDDSHPDVKRPDADYVYDLCACLEHGDGEQWKSLSCEVGNSEKEAWLGNRSRLSDYWYIGHTKTWTGANLSC